MKKINFIIVTFALLNFSFVSAQVVSYLPYQICSESEVVWSKTIWRRIELSEKINQLLYFSKVPTNQQMSLIDLLLYGIHNSYITPYEENCGNEFSLTLSESEVHERLGKKVSISKTDMVGSTDSMILNIPYISYKVKAYLVKELWFFDKERSIFQVQIIAICPVFQYYRENDADEEEPLYKKLFWIYYPEARELLASRTIYNSNNDTKNLTFDDLFQKRLFSSYIYQESNPYTRSLSEYTYGLDLLLNAEQIKATISNFEHDLWEY